MKYRVGAIVFFLALAAVGLGDFAGQVSTLADPARLADAAEFLGVTEEGQRIRMTFLLPLTALIAALSLSIAIGAFQREYRQPRRLLVTGLLLFYAVFQTLTAIVFDVRAVAFAALFSALCLIAWWFSRQAPSTESSISGSGNE